MELIDSSLLTSYTDLENLQKLVKNKLHTVLGIDVKVSLVQPNTLERTTGKAKRILDLRKEGEEKAGK